MSTPEERTQAWRAVAAQLDAMRALLETPSDAKRLYAFADAFAELARRYLRALREEGKTSMRMDVVVKALDLRTAKSKLEAFVRDVP